MLHDSGIQVSLYQVAWVVIQWIVCLAESILVWQHWNAALALALKCLVAITPCDGTSPLRATTARSKFPLGQRREPVVLPAPL